MLGITLVLALVLVALAQPQAATTQEREPVEVRFESYVVAAVTRADGGIDEVFTAADTANQGDVIEYRLVVTNTTAAALPAVALVGPIPEFMTYVADSATPGSDWLRLEFSADGGQSFSEPPVMITIVQADGTRTQVVAAPELYDAVRWTLLTPLEPNAAEPLTLTYRLTVD
ncbi:MAG: DUF11 domain-containing protein [Trueperaceae bacterium]|nr:DUF11 domain-containing protein [Trueperaceae bacterium]